jgi:putative acetyltransferase
MEIAMSVEQPARKVLIRQYRRDDLNAVIEVFLRSIRETASANYSPEQVSAWAQVDQNSWSERRMSRPTWVAEIEGRIAGFTDLESNGHLDMMYVHREMSGRGAARTLYEAAEQHAYEQGLLRIYSEVSLTARPFFEHVGFDVVAPERVFRNGQWFDRFKMEKHLRPN